MGYNNGTKTISHGGNGMPGLLIKKLPPILHERLKARARRNARSMSAEVIVILERALGPGAGPPPIEVVDGMRVRGARTLTDALIDEGRRRGRP
jgi:plasmid stability protein